MLSTLPRHRRDAIVVEAAAVCPQADILSEARRSRRLQTTRLATALIALGLTTAPHLLAQSPQLTAVFTQMDAAAKRFQSATANVERDNYERVVKETTVEKGTMYIERAGNGLQFGATVASSGDQPGTAAPSRIVNFSGGTLEMYTPAEKQVDVFRSGANGSTLEGYLALGFGGTSQALTSAWNVTDAGPETLSEGGQPVKIEKLVLVSKDPATRNNFKQVTLWLDPKRDISLKQVFETPSGDRQTATYTDIRLNTKPNTAPYKIPTKGVTVVQH